VFPVPEPRAGGVSIESGMIKGFAITVLVLLGAAQLEQLDQYLTHGRYTDVAMSMLRHIRHSFRV